MDRSIDLAVQRMVTLFTFSHLSTFLTFFSVATTYGLIKEMIMEEATRQLKVVAEQGRTLEQAAR